MLEVRGIFMAQVGSDTPGVPSATLRRLTLVEIIPSGCRHIPVDENLALGFFHVGVLRGPANVRLPGNPAPRPGFDGRRNFGERTGRLVLLAADQIGYRSLERVPCVMKERRAAENKGYPALKYNNGCIYFVPLLTETET